MFFILAVLVLRIPETRRELGESRLEGQLMRSHLLIGPVNSGLQHYIFNDVIFWWSVRLTQLDEPSLFIQKFLLGNEAHSFLVELEVILLDQGQLVELLAVHHADLAELLNEQLLYLRVDCGLTSS